MLQPKIVIGQTDSLLSPILALLGAGSEYEVHTVDSGDRVIEMVRFGRPPDLIILEANLRHPTPTELCQLFKRDSELSGTPILIVDAAGTSDENELIQAGCDDVLRGALHKEEVVARAKSLIRLKSINEHRDDAETVLLTLARTIEAKDPYTLGHADRVAQYAMELGKHLGVSHSDAQTLRKGGMLHDIGKIAIPDAILLKPGRYTPEEFDVMKRHPVLGCEICGKLRTIRDALPLIRHHHEKLDGSGYPDGLKGEQVPALVRIVSLVDIYDALRSQRSYKEAYTLDKTFEIMWQEANKGWWDKDLLSAWEGLIRSGKKAANDA